MKKRKIWLITWNYKKSYSGSLRTSEKKALVEAKRMQKWLREWSVPTIIKRVSNHQWLIKTLDGKKILGFIYIQHLEVK